MRKDCWSRDRSITIRSVSRSVSQSVGRSVGQLVSRSVGQSTGRFSTKSTVCTYVCAVTNTYVRTCSTYTSMHICTYMHTLYKTHSLYVQTCVHTYTVQDTHIHCTNTRTVLPMTSGGQTGSQLAVNQRLINGHVAVKVRMNKMADLIDF